jgi:hypothetical protein
MTVGAAVQLAVTLKQLNAGGRQVSFQPAGIAPVFLVRYICRTFFTKIGETAAMVVVLGRPSRYWGRRTSSSGRCSTFCVSPLWLGYQLTVPAAHRGGYWPWPCGSRCSRCTAPLGGTYNVSERYAFSSEVLIGLSLSIGVMKREKSHLQKVAGTLLLTLFLASGTFEYFYYHRWIDQERPAAPDWTSQVSAWRRNPEQELIVWPKGWPAFTLPPRHR